MEENIIQQALNNNITEQQILQYIIDNGADEQLLSKLGYMNARIGKIINAGFLDYIYDKCKNNKKLLAGVVALLLSSGQLYGYTIKNGDNLWNIAKSSNCKIEQLYQLNPELKNIKFIKPGMKIVIPSEIKNKQTVNNNNNNEIHVVQKGDTLSGIALQYNMKLDELKKMNPQIQDFNKINIGDKINVKEQKLNLDAAIKALREVESKNGSNASDGDNGKAVGEYQLWQIFVNEYHRLGGKKEYQCHIVNGIAQKDDVRRDRQKSQEMIKFVFEKLGYKNMTQVIKGYSKKGKFKTIKIQGWNSGASDVLLKKYLDAYEKYS